MSVRRVTKSIATITAAAAIASLSALAISGTAGAAATQIPNAIVPQSPYSTGTPFDSGQQVDVSIPGGYLPATTNAYIFECAAPNGVLPTSTTQCDGNTNYGGGTLTTESNGALDVVNDSPLGNLYTIFYLPDYYKLGETGTSAANCGLGAARECVLYIGTGGASDTGMAQPHVFSQVFERRARPRPTLAPPTRVTRPEVPLAVGLPLLAAGIFGGTVLVRRRRAARATS